MLTTLAILIVGIIAITASIHKSISPHTVFGFFLNFSILSILIRSLYLDYNVAIDIVDPWNSFLYGLTKDDLISGSFLYMSFVLLMCFGFTFFSPKMQLNPVPYFILRKSILNYRCMLNTLRIFNYVSLISFIYFVYVSIFTGNLLDQAILFSAYRGISSDLDSYNANGFVRYLISWSSVTGLFAFYFVLTNNKTKIDNKTIGKFKNIIYVSLLISSSMSVFSQSRSTLIFTLLNYLLIYRICIGRWNVIRYVVPLIVVLTAVFYAMTAVRAGSGFEEDSGTFNLTKISAPIILNNGGLDIGKTILIINHFQKNNEYLLGASFYQLVLSYVPRSIWKDKPVNLDTMIGIEVYGANTFGTGAVPPGLPAELFINFHYAGFFIGALIVGILAKIVHMDYLKNHNKFLYPVVFVYCLIYTLHSFVGSGFAQTMMGVMNNYLTICMMLIVYKMKNRK